MKEQIQNILGFNLVFKCVENLFLLVKPIAPKDSLK